MISHPRIMFVCFALWAAFIPTARLPAQLLPTDQQGRHDYGLPQLAKDYATAVQRMRTAEESRDRARLQLESLQDSLRKEAASSPERQRARAMLSQTREAYLLAHDQVMSQLRTKPDYIALKKNADDIDAKIQQLHQQTRETKASKDAGQGDDLRPQIIDLSNEKLRVGDRITSAEARALQDAGAEKLRDAWIAAKQHLDELESEQLARIDKDPTVVAAQGRLTDARGDVADARAQLAGAEAAYRQASAQEDQDDRLRNRLYSYPYYSPYFPYVSPYVSPYTYPYNIYPYQQPVYRVPFYTPYTQ